MGSCPHGCFIIMKKKLRSTDPSKLAHPVSGLTGVQEKQKLKAALRQVWRKSSRANHLREVRFPHPDPNSRFKYAVRCTHCGTLFGQSEKTTYITKTGRRRRTGAYHVNHKTDTSMPPINDVEQDLGAYALALLHTELEVVCVPCHALETARQVKNKRALRENA